MPTITVAAPTTIVWAHEAVLKPTAVTGLPPAKTVALPDRMTAAV